MKVLKHIVMWKFSDEAEGMTKQQNMAIVTERLRGLIGVVPSLMALEIGEDVLHSGASYDMALICTFRDVDGMLAYRDDPNHRAVAEYIHKVIYDRVTADFYVHAEPDFVDKKHEISI